MFYEGAVALAADVDEDEVPAGVPFSPRQVLVVLEDQVWKIRNDASLMD